MARARSDVKRESIKQAAKELFARKGFAATSIADIRDATGFSTGTLYTYFSSKDGILRAIVDEGWEQAREQFADLLASRGSTTERIDFLCRDFLPQLMRDRDFIHILINETTSRSDLPEKISALLDLVDILRRQSGADHEYIRHEEIRAAVALYFTGMLGASRLAQSGDLGYTEADLFAFLARSLRQALGVGPA